MHATMLLTALALWTPGQVPRTVEALLQRASKAPHNGYNPELVVPPEELTAARDGLEEAVRHGSCAWARDAASLLTRLPEPKARRAFWVSSSATRTTSCGSSPSPTWRRWRTRPTSRRSRR